MLFASSNAFNLFSILTIRADNHEAAKQNAATENKKAAPIVRDGGEPPMK